MTVEKIFSAITDHYGISRDDMVGKKREKAIAEARHISIYLIREITEMSFPNIGKLYDRDHTTILSSYQKISRQVKSDPVFALELNELKKGL